MAKKITIPAKHKAQQAADMFVSGGTEPKNKRLTIDIPESLHRRAKVGSAVRGVALADVIREFLEKEFPA